ncbi:2OG-Fe(II) oxygenase family oxidoreductase [Penicillium brasilianum]|uniref:2OG-Fe(II) oxygenase family oxidoreductase n=1 Tax=Penicillium brasilianum TaxID=104259 RepID=A0A1S9RJ45_PENBI|nr:2OG-Fe(II) oxygenase family oxidoreductase [Penicillium brasilianum]
MSQQADSSQLANCDHIPVIDLSSIDSVSLEERQKLARTIFDACTQVGFFYIKNHGIPEELVNGIHNAAARFFGLPEEEKMKYYIGNSQKFRGYSPIGGEKSTGTEDDPVPEDEAVGVLSEAFDIGYEVIMDSSKSKDAGLPPDPYELYGDNQWPDEETIAGFSETYVQYCISALDLCRKMMKIFALALGLPETYFDSSIQTPGVTSRMMHYPAQPVPGEVQEGLGAHTDWECFTILSQGKVPGLEILNHKGDWILAPPIPGTLVVNIADCLSTWTNKTFKSTIHRVNNLSGEERYSIPFFFGVDYDATVSVLDKYTSSENPPCRPPFKAGDWVREKLSRAYVGYEG